MEIESGITTCSPVFRTVKRFRFAVSRENKLKFYFLLDYYMTTLEIRTRLRFKACMDELREQVDKVEDFRELEEEAEAYKEIIRCGQMVQTRWKFNECLRELDKKWHPELYPTLRYHSLRIPPTNITEHIDSYQVEYKIPPNVCWNPFMSRLDSYSHI